MPGIFFFNVVNVSEGCKHPGCDNVKVYAGYTDGLQIADVPFSSALGVK